MMYEGTPASTHSVGLYNEVMAEARELRGRIDSGEPRSHCEEASAALYKRVVDAPGVQDPYKLRLSWVDETLEDLIQVLPPPEGFEHTVTGGGFF